MWGNFFTKTVLVNKKLLTGTLPVINNWLYKIKQNLNSQIFRIQLDLAPLLSEVEGKKSELETYMKGVSDLSGKMKKYTTEVEEKKTELDLITNQIETSSQLLEYGLSKAIVII